MTGMKDGVEVGSQAVPVELSADVFRELYPRLRRFAAVVGAAESDPDDLVQEALARTLELDAAGSVEHLEAYLRRCVVNIESNRRRGSGRRQRREQLVADPESSGSASYPSDLADLDRLDPTDRAVLYLREVEMWSYAEIGELLGVSDSTVRGRASTARRSLRHLMTIDEES